MSGKISPVSRCIVIAALAVGAAWAGKGILGSERAAQSPSSTEASSSPNSPLRATTPARGLASTPYVLSYQPKAPGRFRYAFQRQIHFQGLGQSLPPIEFRGTLFLDVYESDARGFSAIVTEEIVGQPKTKAALRIYVTSAAEEIKVFSPVLNDEAEQQHADILRDLVSTLIFPLKIDTVGRFDAKFLTLTREQNFPRLSKSKLAYLDVLSAPHIESSLHVLKWNETLRLPEEVQGTERTRLGEGKMSLLSDSSYLVRFEGHEAIAPLTKAELAKFKDPTQLALTARAQSPAENAAEAARRWPALREQLLNIANMAQGEQLKLFGELVRALNANASLLGDLVALLTGDVLKQGAHSAIFRTVIGTLATAGSPEAQAALRKVYDTAAVPVSGKGTILAALTTTEASIDADTRAFLQRTMRAEDNADLSLGAAFALGSSLQRAPEGPQRDSAVKQILGAWNDQSRPGGSRDTQLALLDVMGNSGSAEFFPTIARAATQAPDSMVRAKAVLSLRFVNDSGATDIIVRAMGDSDPVIRGAAVTAATIGTWREAYRAPITQCALAESVPDVQSACIKLNQQRVAASD